jgi:predicted dehydrogenase
MIKKIKVGIIGFGKIGKIRKKIIDNHPNLELVSIADPNPIIEENDVQYKIFKNYKELLRLNLDAVFICTPNKYTPVIVKDALNKKMHVFCEKPPGRTIEDIEMMINAEKKNPEIKLKFGFNHRYHDNVLEAKSIVESGRFGKILWMRGVYGKSGGINFKNIWRSRRDISGGGILLDQGVHMIDLFRFFCGGFEEVKSFISNSFWELDVENDAFAILRNKKGQLASLHSSSTQWKHTFSLEISLEKGYINLYGILSSTRSYGQGEHLVTASRQFEDEAYSIGNPQENITYFNQDKSWEREVNDFVDCILNNKKVITGSSKDAIAAMELVYKIYNADPSWVKKIKKFDKEEM